MTIDLLLSWPRNCDYPFYRRYIIENRQRFQQVIIAFTETHQGDDYRQFIEDALWDYGITFIQPRMVINDDWRNVSTNAMLSVSSADWVYFSEQDFQLNDAQWAAVIKLAEKNDVIGFKDGDTRFHPASLLVRRSMVDLTKKDFGIVPNISDHFSRFYSDLVGLGARIYDIPELAQYHMNGLSHNLTLLYRGEEITYKPDLFRAYIKDSLLYSGVQLDPRYIEMCKRYLKQ